MSDEPRSEQVRDRLQRRLEAARTLGLRITGWVLTEAEWYAIYEAVVTYHGGEESAQNAAGLSIYVPWHYRVLNLPISGIRGMLGDPRRIKRNPQRS